MTAALKLMTPDEFLVWCLDQPDRWELVNGHPVRMMTGARQSHDAIVVNLIASLHQRLRGKPCRPSTADIASRMPTGNIRRPDVTVDCGRREPDSLESSGPTVFFEVLSPSTHAIDQLQKPEEYRRVPTLRHLVVLEPGIARAWVLSRPDEAAEWSSQDLFGLSAVIDLPAIGLTLPMAEVYEGVELEV